MDLWNNAQMTFTNKIHCYPNETFDLLTIAMTFLKLQIAKFLSMP